MLRALVLVWITIAIHTLLPGHAQAEDTYPVPDENNVSVFGDVNGNRAQVIVDQTRTETGSRADAPPPGANIGSSGSRDTSTQPAGYPTELTPGMFCLPFGTPESDPCMRRADPAAPAAAAPAVDPQVVAREAALELTVPKPGLVIGPDPAGNRWNMLAIGMPVWVGDPRPTNSVADQVTSQGIAISMDAARTTTTVDFGDGTRIQCSSMTVRPAGTAPSVPSPDCGDTYITPGNYTVTVTSQWQVTWSAVGQTGVVPLTSSTSTALEVGEIGTVLVPEG